MPFTMRATLRIVLILLAALLIPEGLLAHARLTGSTPAAGATLAESPREVRLVFSERPEVALVSLRIISGTDTLAVGQIERDPSDANAIVGRIGSALTPGPHRILWSVTARDGHRITGAIDFSVAAPAGVAAPAETAPPPDLAVADDASGTAPAAVAGAFGVIAVRWLGFAALFAMIGAVAFRFFVMGRLGTGDADTFVGIASTNAATLGFVAAGGLVLSSAIRLARESSDMPDIPMTSILFGSSWGRMLFAQLVVAALAGVGFRLAHRAAQSSRANGWRLALVSALVLGAIPALSGHAIGGNRAPLAVPADIIHVIVGSAWLGTLLVIVIVGIPAALKTPDALRPGARVAAMINAFSPLALMCGGIVVATGIGSSVIRVPRLDALWTTPYGVVLSLKLMFVALLFLAGAWNWRRMKPRLTGDDAVGPLRSSASLELILAGAVLAITSFLVALEPP